MRSGEDKREEKKLLLQKLTSRSHLNPAPRLSLYGASTTTRCLWRRAGLGQKISPDILTIDRPTVV